VPATLKFRKGQRIEDEPGHYKKGTFVRYKDEGTSGGRCWVFFDEPQRELETNASGLVLLPAEEHDCVKVRREEPDPPPPTTYEIGDGFGGTAVEVVPDGGGVELTVWDDDLNEEQVEALISVLEEARTQQR